MCCGSLEVGNKSLVLLIPRIRWRRMSIHCLHSLKYSRRSFAVFCSVDTLASKYASLCCPETIQNMCAMPPTSHKSKISTQPYYDGVWVCYNSTSVYSHRSHTKRQELLFLAVRRTKWTETQRAEVIHPVSHNSVMGPEIKPPAEEPPDKNPCLSHLYKWPNFTPMHLKTNGGSKKDKGQNSIPRRGEKGFQVSLKQEAVVKTCFEDQVEGKETTRWRKLILTSRGY